MTTTVERPAPAYREPRMAPDTRRRLSIVIVGVAAWIIGLIFVAPVLWMVLTSLHSEPDAATNPPSFFAPLTLDGVPQLLRHDRREPLAAPDQLGDGRHRVHDPGAGCWPSRPRTRCRSGRCASGPT